MKQLASLLIICLLSNVVSGQTVNSWNGKGLQPNVTYHSLNVFVNIIYNMSVGNPYTDDQNWPNTTIEGINSSIPDYLLDFLDVNFSTPANVHGTMTRLYYESSFGSFVFLGDFIVVNIKHSRIKPSGGTFTGSDVRTAVIEFINSAGFSSLYGHNNITDYDSDGNTMIDMIQFLIRNAQLIMVIHKLIRILQEKQEPGYLYF